MISITVEEAQALRSLGAQFVDVRTPGEFRSGHVPGACNIPLEELESRLEDLDSSRRIVLLCQAGQRAELGACCLNTFGISANVVQGGTRAWERAGFPPGRAREKAGAPESFSVKPEAMLAQESPLAKQ